MKGFLLGVSGTLDNAVNTTKINNPKKKSNDAISETQINHLFPTVAGIIMLKKSI